MQGGGDILLRKCTHSYAHERACAHMQVCAVSIPQTCAHMVQGASTHMVQGASTHMVCGAGCINAKVCGAGCINAKRCVGQGASTPKGVWGSGHCAAGLKVVDLQGCAGFGYACQASRTWPHLLEEQVVLIAPR